MKKIHYYDILIKLVVIENHSIWPPEEPELQICKCFPWKWECLEEILFRQGSFGNYVHLNIFFLIVVVIFEENPHFNSKISNTVHSKFQKLIYS